MAELQGDNITNSAGTGAPAFPFGVEGSISGNPAATGAAGQLVQTILAQGSSTSILNAVGTSLFTFTLPPGDWDVDFVAQVSGVQGAGVSQIRAGLSTVVGDTAVIGSSGIQDVLPTGTYLKAMVMTQHINTATTLVYNLNVFQDTGVTWQGWGRVSARRSANLAT